MDNLVFYKVTMEKRDDDAYLVTGNQKYYPITKSLGAYGGYETLINKLVQNTTSCYNGKDYYYLRGIII